jgi:hypothetical protein
MRNNEHLLPIRLHLSNEGISIEALEGTEAFIERLAGKFRIIVVSPPESGGWPPNPDLKALTVHLDSHRQARSRCFL